MALMANCYCRCCSLTYLLMLTYVSLAARPSRNKISQSGDFQLGGIFDIYKSIPTSYEDVTMIHCSGQMTDEIMLVEAMVFAIEQINQNEKLLPMVTLGYDIQATCDDVRQYMIYALDEFTALDAAMENPTFIEPAKVIISLIGPRDSLGSYTVSSLFRILSIPVISYAASDPQLADMQRFPTFFRTCYSNKAQARALADLIERFGWNYVAVIGSDDTIGRSGIAQLKAALWDKRSSICLSVEKYLSADPSEKQVKEVVDALRVSPRGDANTTTNVTLLWMNWPTAKAILVESDAQGLDYMTWLGVDAWTSGYAPDFLNLPSRYLNGTIATKWPLRFSMEFILAMMDNDYLRKRVEANHWLQDFICQKCLADFCVGKPPSCVQPSCSVAYVFSAECSDARSPFSGLISVNHERIVNVIQAVYATAYALDSLLSKPAPTDSQEVDVTILSSYQHMVAELRNVNFTFGDYPPVNFDANGDLEDAMVRIANLADTSGSGAATNSMLASRDIGYWLDYGNSSYLNFSRPIAWRGGVETISQCHAPCSPGTKIIYAPSACCWECEPCPQGTISNNSQSTRCYKCPPHYHTNEDHTECVENQLTWIYWTESAGVFSLLLCLIGYLVWLPSIVFVMVYRNVPIVQATKLKTIKLFLYGLGLSLQFYYSTPPSPLVCQLRRVIWPLLIISLSTTGFLTTPFGFRHSLIIASKLRIPSCISQELAFLFICGLANGLFAISVVTIPSILELVDIAAITGQESTQTFVDCGELGSSFAIDAFSFLYPAAFWLANLVSCLRSKLRPDDVIRFPEEMNKQSIEIETRYVNQSAYLAALIFTALAPTYLTTKDPYTRTFVALIGGYAAVLSCFGLFIVPKARCIWLKKQYGRSTVSSMSERSPFANGINIISVDSSTGAGAAAGGSGKSSETLRTNISSDSDANSEVAAIDMHGRTERHGSIFEEVVIVEDHQDKLERPEELLPMSDLGRGRSWSELKLIKFEPGDVWL